MGTVSQITSSIPSGLQSITTAAQQYIVAPIAAFGLAGLVFNAQGESIVNLAADISDHYAEDNTALQDQIAIKPKKITLKGYIGELVYNSPGNGPSTINTLAQKLTTVAAYLPALTAGATTIVNGIANPSTLSLSSVSNIYGLVQNILGAFGNMANQQNAYTYFRSLMESKTLMGVQTPWEFMTNMAIESVVAIQDEKTQYISDFAVTYKAMRIASTATTAFSAGGTGGLAAPGGPSQQGASSIMAQLPTNLGNITGASTSTTASSLSSNSNLANIFKA